MWRPMLAATPVPVVVDWRVVIPLLDLVQPRFMWLRSNPMDDRDDVPWRYYATTRIRFGLRCRPWREFCLAYRHDLCNIITHHHWSSPNVNCDRNLVWINNCLVSTARPKYAIETCSDLCCQFLIVSRKHQDKRPLRWRSKRDRCSCESTACPRYWTYSTPFERCIRRRIVT